MNISSTPFIRNDYWPDYNDINELNKRIDEIENELSLDNIRLSSDIENVSNNLNSYVNNQANTTITNNIIANNINANYAEGRFANFDNSFTNNVYIENLTVNKPVFDLTLNTAHMENTTSLGGNFYNTNLIDPKFSGDASGDFNTVNVNIINANTANISNLFVNIQPSPITSSAVLGYDIDGRVIPIHATFDVGFPENADYLYTDSQGTAFAGTKDTSVGESNNLITSFAVKNALDDYANTVNDSFNLVNNSLNDIDSWQNNIENNIANSFNDVNNTFNDVNNNFSNIANSFNDVNNTFNDVNNNFSNIANSFNDVNNTANNLLDNVDYLKATLTYLLNMPAANVSGWTNSTSPVDIQSITSFVVTPFGASAMTGSGVGNGAKLNVNGTTATLGLPGIQWTMPIMNHTFDFCASLNQNILIPNGVTTMTAAFQGCANLNQNILIPNSVTSMQSAFALCANLNQNILIPNSVTSMPFTFAYCDRLNQNILIPNSVTNMCNTFSYSASLNQDDMYIYSQNVTNMEKCFGHGGTIPRIGNIHIPTSVPKVTSNYMYNCLVNGNTGITFAAANIINDLPVDIEQWPPV